MLLLLTLFAFSACSDTQNIKPKTTNKSINAITIEFSTKTTTENGVTIQEIDTSTFKKYTQVLSDIFSKGSRVPALFIATIIDEAKPIFDPPKNATDEKVFIDLNILKSETATDNIAVAHIKQSKTESGKTLERSGIIYINNEGIVTGFKLDIFNSTTTNTDVPKATV